MIFSLLNILTYLSLTGSGTSEVEHVVGFGLSSTPDIINNDVNKYVM